MCYNRFVMGRKPGFHHTETTKQKLRKVAIARGQHPPIPKPGRGPYKSSPRGGHKWTPQQREKFIASMKPVWESVEYRERHRQHRLTQTFPSRMTSLEQNLYYEFKKRRLGFVMHKTMFG